MAGTCVSLMSSAALYLATAVGTTSTAAQTKSEEDTELMSESALGGAYGWTLSAEQWCSEVRMCRGI